MKSFFGALLEYIRRSVKRHGLCSSYPGVSVAQLDEGERDGDARFLDMDGLVWGSETDYLLVRGSV